MGMTQLGEHGYRNLRGPYGAYANDRGSLGIVVSGRSQPRRVLVTLNLDILQSPFSARAAAVYF